jgi:hypothetical protein
VSEHVSLKVTHPGVLLVTMLAKKLFGRFHRYLKKITFLRGQVVHLAMLNVITLGQSNLTEISK